MAALYAEVASGRVHFPASWPDYFQFGAALGAELGLVRLLKLHLGHFMFHLPYQSALSKGGAQVKRKNKS